MLRDMLGGVGPGVGDGGERPGDHTVGDRAGEGRDYDDQVIMTCIVLGSHTRDFRRTGCGRSEAE